MQTNALHWPDGARLAVLITVMFESWSEGKAPPYSPMTTPLKPGTVDRLGSSWASYGGKTGIWRIMRVLEECGIRGTICVSGRSVELFPEAVTELHKKGHELAAHSYTQDTILPYLTAEEEREVICKCGRIFEKALGLKPVGWFSPVAASTEHTLNFLAEEGFLWHGDYNDTDLAYPIKTPRGTLVAVPHSDFTDNRVLRGSPRDFYQIYRDTFDFLYRNEENGMINLTVHAHFGGRPLMSAMLAKVLRYMKGFPHIWFARHDEVAKWVLRTSQ
ncbi:MAG: polysaccharide deacetylase family protein [Deltaproteobacteria bacterium]|nr:polysaccharide deacetylase family protein [Deltaproteobacteria bacterium]